jgi:hypothetical protein
VSNSTRLLIIVMCLPLVDGVFVAVVLGGVLDSFVGILEVGLLIFGGSAMVAVILAEMDDTPRQQARTVLAIGSVIIAGAAIQAALAPTIASFLNMAIFERFAALVILAVAASTASATVSEYLPGPAAIIGLGLIATFSPAEATFTIQADPELIARAVAAASVGVSFGVVLALTSPWLRSVVELDRFRFGSAVALGVLAVSIVGLIPSEAPVALVVLAVTALLAFDPDQAESDRDSGEEKSNVDDTGGEMPVSDGGHESPEVDSGEATLSNEGGSAASGNDVGPGQERPPWL